MAGRAREERLGARVNRTSIIKTHVSSSHILNVHNRAYYNSTCTYWKLYVHVLILGKPKLSKDALALLFTLLNIPDFSDS